MTRLTYELAVVRVFVTDWPAAVAFYSDVLGLPLKERHEEWSYASFDAGCSIAVEGLAPDDPEARSLIGRYVGISLRVPDIQETYRELVSRGVAFLGEPGRQPWGGILAHLKDPSGNVLTLVEFPR